MNRPLRIVFLGTPKFAVPSLDILVRNGYEIAGVVTAPGKPSGRGQQLSQSAVKKYASENELRILQPLKLKDENFIQELRSLNANLFIVVAFRMLPEVIWQMPEYGTFNLHASLLPQYRGAAPINWAIINGENETGVTTFFLEKEIDTGNIIFQDKIQIENDDNAGILHDKLSVLGAELVLKTVQSIETDAVKPTPQLTTYHLPLTTLKQAPKLFKDNCKIDWNKPAKEIHNFIRGLSPYPAAYTQLDGKVLKIFSSKICPQSTDDSQQLIKEKKAVGRGQLTIDYQTDGKTYLQFKCADGYLEVLELQLEGKNRMHIDEFLRGYKFS